MTLYLDASAIVPTLIEEASTAALDDFLAAAKDPMVVSEFAAAEVASAVSRLVRMMLMTRGTADELLGEFDAWRASATTGVEFSEADFRVANLFVRRFDLGLRTPDALHTAICRRSDLTLVTLDRKLADAAQVLGVRVEIPA